MGRNSTSCDKSSPKCSTTYKILLRDIWSFQYFDFCSRRLCNELEYRQKKKRNTPSLEQTLTRLPAHRKGSVHGSIFCPVFSEEGLQRNQVDINWAHEYAPISSDGGSPSNECSGCVKQAYLNRSSFLWQAGRGCQVKSSYAASE